MNGAGDSQPRPARLAAVPKAAYHPNMSRRNLLFALALVALPASAPAQTPNATPADDYTQLSESDLLDFRYSFPTIVGSWPTLLSTIRSDRSKTQAENLESARKDASWRKTKDSPFHQYQFWRDWTVAGQTDRLISLRSQTETFTGGAHGMHTTGLMLWDKEKKTEVDFPGLFSSASGYWPLLKEQFCTALNSERLRRFQAEITHCPKPEELVLIPADTNSDWTFDTIRIVADPYVAGVYAEGRYEIPVPVPVDLVTALKPEYRSSFEAQRAQ
jgi:hypothetical protein